MPQQLTPAFGANALNNFQCRLGHALGSPLTMRSDRKTVGFVANQLHQMQNRRVVVERNRGEEALACLKAAFNVP